MPVHKGMPCRSGCGSSLVRLASRTWLNHGGSTTPHDVASLSRYSALGCHPPGRLAATLALEVRGSTWEAGLVGQGLRVPPLLLCASLAEGYTAATERYLQALQYRVPGT